MTREAIATVDAYFDVFGTRDRKRVPSQDSPGLTPNHPYPPR